MLYRNRSFSVPATGKSVIGCEQGHAMLDKWRRCIRCGEKVEKITDVITDNRAMEYSKLRSSGMSVDEATKAVFGDLSPLAQDALEPLTLSKEPA